MTGSSVPTTPETASAPTPETPRSTLSPSHVAQSASSPASPDRPTPRHTTLEEYLPPHCTPRLHSSSRYATATVQTIPTRALSRTLHSAHTPRAWDSPENSTLPH